MLRDFEREIIPMARAEGEGVVSRIYRFSSVLTTRKGWRWLHGTLLGAGSSVPTLKRKHAAFLVKKAGPLGVQSGNVLRTKRRRRLLWRRLQKKLEPGTLLLVAAMHLNILYTLTPFLSVAIAYVMHKAPYVFPIIGCRKVEQLDVNIEALDISLTDEQIKELESAVEFDIGFPSTIVVSTKFRLHAGFNPRISPGE